MADESADETGAMTDRMPVPADRRGAGSAVSWGAIFAGAATAAALSLILLVLGMGLGLAAVSPWTRDAGTTTALTASMIAWLGFTAVAASALGGYLAGRLRVRWPGTPRDEVYFRDTAHGLLSWAVATLLTAAALTSVTVSILGTGTTTASSASGVPQQDEPMYVVDSLFRLPAVRPDTAYGNASSSTRAEMARIFANNMRTGPLPAEDVRYAAQLVSQSTGLTLLDAEKRVSTAYLTEQQRLQVIESAAVATVDRGRRNAAHASLWVFASLLLGAFSASLAATFGGRRRDLA